MNRARRLAGTVFAAYVAISWTAHERFPFSRFAMFSRTPTDSASRLEVMDAEGRRVEVEDLTDFSCESLDGLTPTFGGSSDGLSERFAFTPYRVEEFRRYILAHSRGADTRGEDPRLRSYRVIRRIWRIREDKTAMRQEIQIITTCTSRPKAP